MQVKGASDQLKGETNAKDEDIRKLLKDISERYYA